MAEKFPFPDGTNHTRKITIYKSLYIDEPIYLIVRDFVNSDPVSAALFGLIQGLIRVCE